MQTQNNYNPDVLSCLANLSSDEVFTPPKLANEILDLLPKEIWKNKNATFFDPVCKSGVFLREIAKRLLEGLKDEIPDIEKRIEHIYNKQIFGIGITELTSLLSRRSLYCSKSANGKYSIVGFDNEKGNIFFDKTNHDWQNGRCSFCGASQSEYEREEGLESHAYQFIHNNLPDKIKNMKFDVIIGNPPYQLNDAGGDGSSATPLYHYFVEQAIKLSPRYLTMIIPARWYSGGKGLDEFREKILNDKKIAVLHDFPETSDCFPGLNIRGGVCYFLWSKDHKGDSRIVNHIKDKVSVTERPLLEKGVETFVRYNQAIEILRKVLKTNPETMDKLVSSRNVFGIPSNFDKYSKNQSKDKTIKLYRGDRSSRTIEERTGYVNESVVVKGKELIDKIKVIVSKASPGGDEYPHSILSRPMIAGKNSVCTETYLIISTTKNLKEAENLISYISTKFFRFMLALIKNTQNISKSVFAFVPLQDFSESWTDEKLYKKYKLTKEEIEFIESMIRPMN